jgi:Tfp pilus assembly PilM family ATPase
MGRGDAIVIDVGGECTDVVVVRHGGIDGLRSLPLGAVTFTRRTGRAFGVPLPAAEEIKRAYAAGALDAERTADLRTALASDIATWVGAVLACLSDLSADEDLPGAIYLCGAGAALPDIEKSLRSQRWLHALPFAHEPGVLMLKSSSMAGPDDQARLADKDSFVGALALATRMMRRARMAPIGAAQQALQRVLDGMRLS